MYGITSGIVDKMHGATLSVNPNGVLTASAIPARWLCVVQVLEVLKEAHGWLCKENEAEVRKTLGSRGWLSAFDLQPDVPFPERK